MFYFVGFFSQKNVSLVVGFSVATDNVFSDCASSFGEKKMQNLILTLTNRRLFLTSVKIQNLCVKKNVVMLIQLYHSHWDQ